MNLSKKVNSTLQANGNIAKTVSALYIGAFLISVWAITSSYNYSVLEGNKYTLQNIGRILALSQVGLLALLSSIQNGVYSWSLRNKQELDERQAFVRSRVMEKSYGIAMAIMFIATWILINSEDWIVAHQGFANSNDLRWIPFSLLFLLMGLPVIVASWRKDS